MAITLRLRYPISFDGTTINELTFRERVCAGDMRGLKIDELAQVDSILRLASRLTGQPDPVLNKLDAVDVIRITEVVTCFFVPGPTSGSGSSP